MAVADRPCSVVFDDPCYSINFTKYLLAVIYFVRCFYIDSCSWLRLRLACSSIRAPNRSLLFILIVNFSSLRTAADPFHPVSVSCFRACCPCGRMSSRLDWVLDLHHSDKVTNWFYHWGCFPACWGRVRRRWGCCRGCRAWWFAAWRWSRAFAFGMGGPSYLNLFDWIGRRGPVETTPSSCLVFVFREFGLRNFRGCLGHCHQVRLCLDFCVPLMDLITILRSSHSAPSVITPRPDCAGAGWCRHCWRHSNYICYSSSGCRSDCQFRAICLCSNFHWFNRRIFWSWTSFEAQYRQYCRWCRMRRWRPWFSSNRHYT